MVNNLFYDPATNQTCQFCTTPELFYQNGIVEPIWKTLEKQSFLKSVSYFWPGSMIEGLTPTFYVTPYVADVPYSVRADQLISWLRDPSIALLTSYINEPDHSGHIYGPISQEVKQAISNVNDFLGLLLQEIHSQPEFYHDLNIIVTSDHGMARLDNNKALVLDQFLNSEEVVHLKNKFISFTTGAHIWCEPDLEIERFNCQYYLNRISSIIGVGLGLLRLFWGSFGTLLGLFLLIRTFAISDSSHKNKFLNKIKIYKKEDIPEHLHYKHSDRIPPLVIFCDLPYQVHLSKPKKGFIKGDHGYDNSENEMHPIFIAAGKKIRKYNNSTQTVSQIDNAHPNETVIDQTLIVPPFNNINLYHLFCEILDLKPSKYARGSSENIRHLLNDDGIEWYSLGKMNFQYDWDQQKIIGVSCMVLGILVGLYAVIFVDEDEKLDYQKIGNSQAEIMPGESGQENLGFESNLPEHFDMKEVISNLDVSEC